MFLIKIGEQKYWTDSYISSEGFITFTTKSKDGKEADHTLKMDKVDEIIATDVDVDKPFLDDKEEEA
jgi:hypothetical protein